jgi:hypothetical protein
MNLAGFYGVSATSFRVAGSKVTRYYQRTRATMQAIDHAYRPRSEAQQHDTSLFVALGLRTRGEITAPPMHQNARQRLGTCLAVDSFIAPRALSRSIWRIAISAPGSGKVSRYRAAAGDVSALRKLLARGCRAKHRLGPRRAKDNAAHPGCGRTPRPSATCPPAEAGVGEGWRRSSGRVSCISAGWSHTRRQCPSQPKAAQPTTG